MSKRRSILTTIGTTGAIVIAGCTGSSDTSDSSSSEDSSSEESSSDEAGNQDTSSEESSSEESSEEDRPTVEEVKNQASEIPYEDLMRNSEQYEGEYVHFPSGEVTQVIEESYGFGLRVYVSEDEYSWEDDIFVYWNGDRYLEDDIIEIWAEFNGLLTYETALGSERTIPEVTAADIELLEEVSAASAEDVEIVEHELVVEQGGYSTERYVEGIIANNAETEASYIEVVVRTYDSDGNQLESYSDSTTNLAANTNWSFSVDLYTATDDFDDYDISIRDVSF